MKIVLMDLWTDANRGDEALQGGLVTMLRHKHPKAELVGVFRFGRNEFLAAQPEIAKTVALLDRAYGGLRRTLYAGNNALKLKGIWHNLFSLFSFAEVAVFLLVYKLGLKSWLSSPLQQLMDDIVTADAVVWKGKNFRAYGGLAGGNRQATLLVAGVIARVLNPRLFCVNASIWPMVSGLERTMVRAVLGLCRSVSVRDSGSFAAAKQLGLQNVFMAHDLSFYYLNLLATQNRITRKTTAVAVTVTQWGSAQAQAGYVQALVEAVAALAGKGVTDVYVVPQVVRAAESSARLVAQFAEGVAALGVRCNVHIMEGDMSIPQLLEAYAGCALLLGTRMHSCVFARFVETPFIGIAYDDGPKWDILREFWPVELIVPYTVAAADLAALAVNAYTQGDFLVKNSAVAFEKLPELSYLNVRDV